MFVNTRLLIIYCIIIGVISPNEAGKFWQITDIHVDANYSTNGDINKMCHGNDNSSTLGALGSYNCDSPWLLAKSAIENMKLIEPNPEFILWTGDSIPHVDESELDLSKVYAILNRIRILLHQTFPNSFIIPVIGNHDTYPSNKFVTDKVKAFYQGYWIKAGFETMVPSEEFSNFVKGGFYIKQISPFFKVIVLNTNLYLMYRTNKTQADQDIQLNWLKQELKLAQDENVSVLITAHVPPGFFERQAIIPFLEPQYNDPLVDLFLNYSNVILSQIYGHTHTDSFRLFFSSKRHLKTHALIAPSVTPFKIPLTGLHGINPSIRLYDYDLNSRMIMDYKQYFLNLSQVNEDNSSTKAVSWNVLYQATSFYKTHNLSTNSLGILYQDIATKPDIFNKYYSMNSAGADSDPCDKICRKVHICAIAQLTVKDMENCINKSSKMIINAPLNAGSEDSIITVQPVPSSDIPGLNLHDAAPTYTPYILSSSVALIAVLIVVVIFFIRKQQFHSGPRYVRHFSINN